MTEYDIQTVSWLGDPTVNRMGVLQKTARGVGESLARKIAIT